MTDSEKIAAIKTLVEGTKLDDYIVALETLSDIIHIIYGVDKEKPILESLKKKSGTIVDG